MVFLTSYCIISRTVNINEFNLLAPIKSVVVDSYEYDWKFSWFSFSISWKQQCCSQTAKSMLTSSVGIVLFYCMALLVQGRDIFMQSPGTKVSHTSKSSLHTWRAYWDKQSQFIFEMVLGGMYCTVVIKCTCVFCI